MFATHRIVALAVVAGLLTHFGGLSAQSDPGREVWLRLKRALAAPDGESYFELSVKGAQLPALKGTLVSALVNEGVSKLVLAMTDPNTPEVTLVVHTGGRKFKGEPKPGTSIEFEGVAIEFTKSPFMLTLDVAVNDIRGLDLEISKKIPGK